MNPALIGALIMLTVLAAVFVVASHPGAADGWVARLGRGGLVAVLLAVSVAVVGVSLVLLPEAFVVGTALLVAGLLLLAIAALAGLRGRSSDRSRDQAPRADRRPAPRDPHEEDAE